MATIVVADDKADIRKLLAMRLEKHGFHVVTASNGEEAIELATGHRADLAIIDMNMPVLDGWDAARQLRDSKETAAMPIIALTGYALPGDRERALESGCNGYLSKPIDFDALFQMILDLMHAAPEPSAEPEAAVDEAVAEDTGADRSASAAPDRDASR